MNRRLLHNFLLGAASALALVFFSPSSAFQSIVSQHAQLKGSVIVDAGEAKEVAPPFGSEWENQVYSLNSRCMVLFGYYGYWGFGGKPAMLVVDKDEHVQLAIFESTIGSIKVEIHPVSIVHCPDHAMVPPSCDGLNSEACSRLMDEHMKKLEQKLEELKSRQ